MRRVSFVSTSLPLMTFWNFVKSKGSAPLTVPLVAILLLFVVGLGSNIGVLIACYFPTEVKFDTICFQLLISQKSRKNWQVHTGAVFSGWRFIYVYRYAQRLCCRSIQALALHLLFLKR